MGSNIAEHRTRAYSTLRTSIRVGGLGGCVCVCVCESVGPCVTRTLHRMDSQVVRPPLVVAFASQPMIASEVDSGSWLRLLRGRVCVLYFLPRVRTASTD